MGLPGLFLGMAMGKKKSKGGDQKTKTVTKTVTKEAPEAAPLPMSAEEKRRKAMQANSMLGTSTPATQEQGLL